MGLRDAEPVHPHGVHRRVCVHEFLGLQELHVVGVRVCRLKPAVAKDHRGARQSLRDHLLQRHPAFKKFPLLAKLLMPRNSSLKLG